MFFFRALSARFEGATPISAELLAQLAPMGPGAQRMLALDDLVARTPYVVGIRTIDDCDRAGPLSVIAFETSRMDGEVAACGCSAGGTGSSAIIVGLGFMISSGWRRRRRK